MKKIIKKKAEFEVLNNELKARSNSVLQRIEKTCKSFSDFLDEHLKKVDSVASKIIKIELSARNVDEEMATKEATTEKRMIELNAKEAEVEASAVRIRKRETLVDEDNETIKKKKEYLENLEEELLKKSKLILEKTKDFKTATPIKR